jgi:hypothetical protein
MYKDAFEHGQAREDANNDTLGIMTKEKMAIRGTKENILEEIADGTQYCVYGINTNAQELETYKRIMEHLFEAYQLARTLKK